LYLAATIAGGVTVAHALVGIGAETLQHADRFGVFALARRRGYRGAAEDRVGFIHVGPASHQRSQDLGIAGTHRRPHQHAAVLVAGRECLLRNVRDGCHGGGFPELTGAVLAMRVAQLQREREAQDRHQQEEKPRIDAHGRQYAGSRLTRL
jgi:hypothetical protein